MKLKEKLRLSGSIKKKLGLGGSGKSVKSGGFNSGGGKGLGLDLKTPPFAMHRNTQGNGVTPGMVGLGGFTPADPNSNLPHEMRNQRRRMQRYGNAPHTGGDGDILDEED